MSKEKLKYFVSSSYHHNCQHGGAKGHHSKADILLKIVDGELSKQEHLCIACVREYYSPQVNLAVDKHLEPHAIASRVA